MNTTDIEETRQNRGDGQAEPSTFGETQNGHWSRSGAILLDELAEIFRRYVVLPEWAPETLALWTIHTYAFELRDVSAYLGVESPEKRCGKTTLLAVLSKLVSRPVAAANISPSAFFRVIEKVRPTLLIDEADTFLQGNDELRGILNAGYSRETAYVIRVRSEGESSKIQTPSSRETRNPKLEKEPWDVSDPPTHGSCGATSPASNGSYGAASKVGDKVKDKVEDDTWEGFHRYSCWCPKVMAAIGRLPDTLADRCIVIRMHRKRWDEECERLRDLETTDLRQRCQNFVREHATAIRNARAVIPGLLHDRAADIWEPLFVIADLAGGDWPQKARQAAIGLTTIAQENNPIGSFLFDLLFIMVVNKAERMFTCDILDWLNAQRFAHRPWREGMKGKPVTDMWLSQQLRPYGVRSKTFRHEGKVGKGYLHDEIMEVSRRYVPHSEVEKWKEENPREGSASAETDAEAATPDRDQSRD